MNSWKASVFITEYPSQDSHAEYYYKLIEKFCLFYLHSINGKAKTKMYSQRVQKLSTLNDLFPAVKQ